jgi:hypothetical protein
MNARTLTILSLCLSILFSATGLYLNLRAAQKLNTDANRP